MNLNLKSTISKTKNCFSYQNKMTRYIVILMTEGIRFYSEFLIANRIPFFVILMIESKIKPQIKKSNALIVDQSSIQNLWQV